MVSISIFFPEIAFLMASISFLSDSFSSLCLFRMVFKKLVSLFKFDKLMKSITIQTANTRVKNSIVFGLIISNITILTIGNQKPQFKILNWGSLPQL